MAENSRATPNRMTATTDNRGRFEMKRMQRGAWTFSAAAVGYMPRYDMQDVAMIKSLEFRLQPTPAGPPDVRGVTGRVIQADLQATGALLQGGRHQQALAGLEAMLANLPSLTTLNLRIGDAHLAQKDYERALIAYHRLLAADPGHERAKLAIARLHAERGDLQAAESLLNEAAAAGAATAEVYYERGRLRLRQDNTEAAAADFRQAAALSPAWARPLYELALIARGRGDREEAIRQLEQVIALDPDSAGAADARALIEQIKQQ